MFYRVIEEDVHEFLTTCDERLYTLGLVKLRGAGFTAYYLDGPERMWLGS